MFRAAVAAAVAMLAALASVADAWPRAAAWADGAGSSAAPGDFTLLLLHNNDMHSRFEETSRSSGECTAVMREHEECYGGFARVAHVVREARRQAAEGTAPPTIFLNAGDTYQGTVWYTVHKHLIVTSMLNKLAPDAVSLGNHEFDDGVEGLAPFLRDAEFPVLAANINATLEPLLRQPKLLPVAELSPTPARQKIGVVGYLTPETANISFPGKVIFEDEVTAVRREARKLRDRGVNIIIALGHSGYDVDLRIAEQVEEVDVVVGGHTNTFLFTGDQPDVENATDLYPTVVKQASGRSVPVVQAYAYTKYMGRLKLVFDQNGELKAFEGNPQLLNASVPEDEDVKRELDQWRPSVLARTKEVAGRSDVLLEGSHTVCRTQECTLGNMLTDAFVLHHARHSPPSPRGWTDAAVALQHSGGLRSTVDALAAPGHNVTVGQLLLALPFENRMFRCDVEGARLRQALEWSVRRYDVKRVVNPGEFLQFSGLRVTYDLRKKEGQRVGKAQVLCANCRTPNWEPLVNGASYGVLLPHFLLQGGDGFGMLKEIHNTNRCKVLNYTDLTVAIEHFQLRSPVTAMLDDRITFDPPVEDIREALERVAGGAAVPAPSAAMLVIAVAALAAGAASRNSP